MIERVISGGQTGADQGGLDAAIRFWGVHMTRVGGWCPAGRRSEDGPIPLKYPLQEHEEWSYPPRTKKNVQESDGTVVFTSGEPTGGSKLTIEFAESITKTVLHIDLDYTTKEDAIETLIDWCDGYQIETLNVAGPRESTCPGVQKIVEQIVFGALLELGAKP
jgi:hypothetical protein